MGARCSTTTRPVVVVPGVMRSPGPFHRLVQRHQLRLPPHQGREAPGGCRLQVGQEACQVEIHIALAGLGLKGVLIRPHEVAQMVHYVSEDVGRNDAVT